MFIKELINYQNNLYYVYRRHKAYQIKDGYVNDLKEFWGCDVVVRSKTNNDDTLLFLKIIEDAVITQDII